MSTKIFTNKFKTFTINNLLASNPVFYMFLGKATPFADDLNPPIPADSNDETYIDAYDTMIAAKGVRGSDMSYMIPRNEWTTGTAYKAYRSNSGSLYGNQFYASVASASGYDVFKCLSNNSVTGLSTTAPDITATSAADDVYETSDGYQWKYMYSIPTATFDKFATRDYIPVVTNANVTANAVSGSIDYIDVEYGGSNYNTYTSGTIQAVAVSGNTRVFSVESTASSQQSFYVGSAIKIISGVGAGQLREITEYVVSGSTRNVVVSTPFTTLPTTSSTYEITPHVVVTGSGSSFQGRGLVNTAASNSIYKVEIVNRGTGYYHASAVAVGNTGGVSNSAVLTPIMGPRLGHGYNPVTELGAKYLCLTASFNTADTTATNKIVDANQFRSIGIISSPALANVVIGYSGATAPFTIGDVVTQATTGATGVIVSDTLSSLKLRNVSRSFIPGLSITGVLGVTPPTATVTTVQNNGSGNLTANVEYANITTKIAVSSLVDTFVADEMVTMSGNVAISNAVVYYANSTTVWVTGVRGPVNVGASISSANGSATAVIDSVTPPDFIHGTGDILYIENILPINKASGQTETIKAIIEF